MAAVIPDNSLFNRSSSFFSKRKTSFKTDIDFFPHPGFYKHLGILGPDTITCFEPGLDEIGNGWDAQPDTRTDIGWGVEVRIKLPEWGR